MLRTQHQEKGKTVEEINRWENSKYTYVEYLIKTPGKDPYTFIKKTKKLSLAERKELEKSFASS